MARHLQINSLVGERGGGRERGNGGGNNWWWRVGPGLGRKLQVWGWWALVGQVALRAVGVGDRKMEGAVSGSVGCEGMVA